MIKFPYLTPEIAKRIPVVSSRGVSSYSFRLVNIEQKKIENRGGWDNISSKWRTEILFIPADIVMTKQLVCIIWVSMRPYLALCGNTSFTSFILSSFQVYRNHHRAPRVAHENLIILSTHSCGITPTCCPQQWTTFIIHHLN